MTTETVPGWWVDLIRRLYGPKIAADTVARFWRELDPAARNAAAWAGV